MNYYIDTESVPIADVAATVYRLVCRCDFSSPGFALVRQSHVSDSLTHRRELVAIKEALSMIHSNETGIGLGWFTMSRFDQKNTTKLHRDGGPSESLLILGYEPTEVVSEVSIADYSACAHDLNMTPDEFLENFNPMYGEGVDKLMPYTTSLEKFDRSAFQILIVNNSSSPYHPSSTRWQGVLHGAKMVRYEDAEQRVINSTSVVPVAARVDEAVSPERVQQFLSGEPLSVSSY